MQNQQEPKQPLHELICSDLLAGRLTYGDRLSEHALSARYGVSRTPVREALVRLEQDGLIERNGTTARFRSRTAEEINDIYRARSWLEQAIAEDATDRHTDLDLMRLGHALEMGAGVDPAVASPAELVAANRAFHDALGLAAHNAALLDLQNRLTLQIARLAETTLSAPGRWAVAHRQHVEIVDHIRSGNSVEAGRVAMQHMDNARDIRLMLAFRAP